jgi:hypothetical protein
VVGMLEAPDASKVEGMGSFSTKYYVLRPLWVSFAKMLLPKSCKFDVSRAPTVALTHLHHR